MPHYHLIKMIPRRWPFYVFTLVCTLFQAFIALNAPPYDAVHLPTFAVLAIFISLYIGILLCYGHSETEYKHTLTRCYTHITSFGIIALLWFCLGIFFAVHADIECRRHTPICMSLWFSTLLAFLIFFSSCLCVAIVTCPVAVAGVGYNIHVEDARERAQHRDAAIDQNNAHDMSLANLPSPPPAHFYR